MNVFPAWMKPAPDSAVADLLRQGKSPYTDAVHLLWSFWVFITPMFGGGYDLRWLVFTIGSYPLFIVLFAMTLLSSRRISYRYALGMAVLSMSLLAWYPSGVSYFVYACVMLRPGSSRLSGYMLQVLGLNAVFVVLAGWIGYPWQMLLSIPVTTFIIGIIINVEHMAQERDATLKLSQDEVRRIAATAERERIGRDLHDLLGHTLSLITLKLELSRKLIDRDPASARREMEEAEKVARHALGEVRSAVTGIRATDVTAELAAARLMLEASRVHLDYEVPAQPLPEVIERALALVMREATTNIARHARATHARIGIRGENGRLHLDIRDNGRGGVGEDGNGLCGMRERIRGLGGELHIESPRGRGTRITACVPLAMHIEPPLMATIDSGIDTPTHEGVVVPGRSAG